MQEQQRISTLDQDCLFSSGNWLNGTASSVMPSEDKVAISDLVTAEPFTGEDIYRLSCPVINCMAECFLSNASGTLSFIVESAIGSPSEQTCLDGNILLLKKFLTRNG